MYIFVKVDCKDLKQYDFPSWTIKLFEFEFEFEIFFLERVIYNYTRRTSQLVKKKKKRKSTEGTYMYIQLTRLLEIGEHIYFRYLKLERN